MSPCPIWESGRKGVGIGNLECENCELGETMAIVMVC